MSTSFRRVAVTGMGAICGLGHTLPEIWQKLISGQSGVSILENINTEKLPIKIGGEVKKFNIAENLMDPKEATRIDRFNHFALHSANEALGHAGLLEKNPYALNRCGAILGVGMGGFPMIERSYEDFLSKGAKRVSPFFIPSVIPNMTTGLITIQFGFRGINFSIASACASGAHAIGAAADEIKLGRHDMMVTGGAESVMCNLPFSGFASMKALSKNENPLTASRPFDVDRDGFVMGEGAGILILEDLEKAQARGAKIYAEIVGHGATSDAHHITAPHPEGDGAIRCMKLALESANINYKDIGYINAHGTSTPLGDIAETFAVRQVFTDHANKLHISSTKSSTGHLLGAAGGIESIFSIMVLETGIIPPTINLLNQDPKCDLDYTANQAVSANIQYSLNNSFGFGGTNSSTIFKKYN
ncbi:MAG: beta-ketoacyl-[acyl-carrier-protein] synthase II [Bdellovibrionales bacterium RIFOXYD12_FULL_39_22]|nr:MAG: beta-ketoacyl-[acyl-carrier-protein] synthase II [Bdellovibrionales bacterium RIFOXYB1_FULL_39_21]OFZ42997.1 MAG: beta-ketoacyl-[acyl-carrier-protein] synthase II [Bdellovibrionales bacterium RIFOXYC12_FULL_39_17]OFZ50917.1 MAG: beta-ketoacyl-[acyl-carrier-protein] synthase II [Bdellovibrionales bacterium RIFOXYC1_FULL_39_130]OFZ72968.1 MAG: beta-ketoacyl-[acyl-carrier-protein] synthase II [Bdellovibrionales bacterium RIFOXYC2_FULL_39_8]OFZ78140.1 MAG: beta-ketoacyl-[acyl-carrier-protei